MTQASDKSSTMLDPETSAHSPTVTSRHLREFSGAWLVFFCGVAVARWSANSKAAVILAAIGLAVAITGLIRPPLVKLLFSVAMAIAFPIGWVMTRLLLGFLFFGIFTPVGWLFRQLKRDPLHIRRSAVSSYWVQAEQPADRTSYLRQSL
jgi:hypothetical protein